MDYDKKQVDFIGVEANGPNNSKLHEAPLSNNSKLGVLHGAAQYVCQDIEGQISETESISAGLDYPGVGCEHSYLKDSGRATYETITDEEALEGRRSVYGQDLLEVAQAEGHVPSVL